MAISMKAAHKQIQTAVNELADKVRDVTMVLHLFNPTLDWKLVMETGMSVLMNKPLIVVLPEGCVLPEKLRLLADEIVYYPNSPNGFANAKPQVSAAIDRLNARIPSGVQ